jgi:hypothetical protein
MWITPFKHIPKDFLRQMAVRHSSIGQTGGIIVYESMSMFADSGRVFSVSELSMTNENSVESQPVAQPPTTPPTASSTPVSAPATATKKESMRDIWKSSIEDARETLGNTETVTGTQRQIIDAGLLGICVTFLVALLTMQPRAIDANLNNAVITFGIALPLIGWGYLQAAVKTKPGKGQLILQAILMGSAVGESFGELAAAIGVFFIFRHFGAAASAAFIWAAVSALGIVPILAFIGLLVYAVVNRKELAAKQQAKSAGTPAPAQEAISQADSNP